MHRPEEAQEAPRDVARPEPGYFRLRLVRHGPWVPARIVRRPDGQWQAIVNGESYRADPDPGRAPWVFRIWHGGRVIDRAAYLEMLRVKGWAQAHQPDHPAANPRKPIDLTAAPPLF